MISNESVYNLIPGAQEQYVRPPMHKSAFPGTVNPAELPFGCSKLQSTATFGKPDGTNAYRTTEILTKHSKEPILPNPGPPTMKKTYLKPSVPKKDEKPVMGLTSNKNFITSNAIDVILSKPKNVPQEEFRWTDKSDYGKVPLYLKRNKQRVATEKEQLEQYIKIREQPSQNARVSHINPDDRAQLLRHLKIKWQSLNHAYQGLSLCLDTAIKKNRKEELERLLAEVEKDIKTLERGDTVLVVDD
uniref:Enkurin domain-containing protein n=1 Tax=Polytomella parva TaxID=51329 RepID=A0A7S0UIU2_9CHLO|mmetsp:Transcript_10689/g.19519  ORF Transcript_10689/g.19519 Transcript_10689/m.19519 type:complete len:245 (+) Transcript_10689:82-816(+)|eukprot:CAMPEP_0175063938 /NCGR_PEP_ID=MMETSP0052_2-20121109/15045_1 /TAXON_ID=51329 ORGANISM="Polytomella parva, Strain SAG 63-3" /NCGR_SAMPLE_ID=MMETSP0052_2 /ASSEMBLY_ACC=CAM_ASM_000194 /LENGTH=244 /DNA_ID=CAMNT_0016330213 /DNA_START=24 /DNA_END=758 /DNA_ORIENTATION=-